MSSQRMIVNDEAQWYVQKGSRVLGPFSAGEVGRFLLLGRVRSTDRVSRDGELWEPVTQVPELVPEELLDLDSVPGWARFRDARDAGDERRGGGEHGAGRRVERRTERDPERRLREEWARLEELPAGSGLLPWSLLGVTLAALGAVVWLNAGI